MEALTLDFIFRAFSIILIDVLLSGDNAVVIAMAVRSLPDKQRRLGITVGAGGAAVLRIGLTFFAARLLTLNYIKFVGGALILWIAVKLFTDAEADHEGKNATTLWHAMWIILVADITMSVDNILAVAAASQGNIWLLVFGLGLSIAFVIGTSSFLTKLMDRFPIVIYIGAAILGRVGGDMMITDPWIHGLLDPSKAVEIGAEIAGAAGVVLVGWLLTRKSRA